MKKYAGYLLAGMIGFVIAIPATSFGAQIQSMVGKKIQAEYSVEVYGKTLPVKSIVIGGTSYTPNRALADAIGADVRLEDKKVIFTKGAQQVDSEQETSPKSDTDYETKVRTAKHNIEIMKKIIENQQASVNYAITPEAKDEAQKTLDEYNSRLEGYQKELADLEAKQN